MSIFAPSSDESESSDHHDADRAPQNSPIDNVAPRDRIHHPKNHQYQYNPPAPNLPTQVQNSRMPMYRDPNPYDYMQEYHESYNQPMNYQHYQQYSSMPMYRDTNHYNYITQYDHQSYQPMNYRYNYCPRPAPNLSAYGRTQGQHRMMPTYCDPIASHYMSSISYDRFLEYSDQEFSIPKKKKSINKKAPAFNLVNALWVDHRFPLNPSFQNITSTIYRARVENVGLC